MQVFNPCSSDNQQRTEADFSLSELRLGPALAYRADILSVGRKGVPVKILNNNMQKQQQFCCCVVLIPDQVQVGGLEHLHISL